ncbi:hypothetical protein QBC40DRAFT_275307 [Triangularia verruculosa]|uniref:Uncharacterized protein n=1 Tax=Triangularia verruculosa TaxID=2587418 RepID=A0AAN6XLS0_9PEZI|nr:hypothetical protein QBC40DRAFT_275307 [Triangularia verruculosa]
MSTSPIPVATFGKDPKVAEQVREKLLPDIEVVHCSLTLDSALLELPALCSGNLQTAPSSGLGTNAQLTTSDSDPDASTRKVPQAIFFGGGFTDDEYAQISSAVHALAPQTHMIKVQKRDVLAAGSFGPNPDTIAKIYRKKMAAALAAA